MIFSCFMRICLFRKYGIEHFHIICQIVMLLFCPSWSCTIISCFNWFTSLCKNLFNLLEFLAEAFQCHCHHFQCLTVLVELQLLLKTQVSWTSSCIVKWISYVIVVHMSLFFVVRRCGTEAGSLLRI